MLTHVFVRALSNNPCEQLHVRKALLKLQPFLFYAPKWRLLSFTMEPKCQVMCPLFLS